MALINKPQPQPQAQQREMQRNTQPQIASWRPTPYRPVYQKCLIVSLWASATLTGLAAGTVWVAKKVIKQPVTSDPSSNFMNYVKFTVVIAASIATKRYYLKVLNFFQYGLQHPLFFQKLYWNCYWFDERICQISNTLQYCKSWGKLDTSRVPLNDPSVIKSNKYCYTHTQS